MMTMSSFASIREGGCWWIMGTMSGVSPSHQSKLQSFELRSDSLNGWNLQHAQRCGMYIWHS